jgi:hypothetical protein
MAEEAAWGPVRRSSELELEAMRLAGVLGKLDAARIEFVRMISERIDSNPTYSALWKVLRDETEKIWAPYEPDELKEPDEYDKLLLWIELWDEGTRGEP